MKPEMSDQVRYQVLASLAKSLCVDNVYKRFPDIDEEALREIIDGASLFYKDASQQEESRPALADSVRIFTDGASRGNPGKAGAGVAVYDPSDSTEPARRISRYLGRMTNNAAEYHAVLIAIEEVLLAGVRSIVLHTDSELVAKQLNGIYKVKDEGLRNIYLKIKDKLHNFDKWDILHIPREQNKEADRLANIAIDERRVPKPGR